MHSIAHRVGQDLIISSSKCNNEGVKQQIAGILSLPTLAIHPSLKALVQDEQVRIER